MCFYSWTIEHENQDYSYLRIYTNLSTTSLNESDVHDVGETLVQPAVTHIYTYVSVNGGKGKMLPVLAYKLGSQLAGLVRHMQESQLAI